MKAKSTQNQKKVKFKKKKKSKCKHHSLRLIIFQVHDIYRQIDQTFMEPGDSQCPRIVSFILYGSIENEIFSLALKLSKGFRIRW